MPYRESTHPCVSCGDLLAPVNDRGCDYERCRRCGGTWMSVTVLRQLLAIVVPDYRFEELMVHNDGTPRRPCPHCGDLMDIAWIEILRLDQCEAHGVWFDCGALERALHPDALVAEVRALEKQIGL